MSDFELKDIEIRYFSDDWGPFSFNFPSSSSQSAEDGAIPFGDTIAGAAVKAYTGNVKPGMDLGDQEDLTSVLIDSTKPPVVSPNNIQVYFNYPGSTHTNKKATLIFELTLTSGAKHAFYYTYVKIK